MTDGHARLAEIRIHWDEMVLIYAEFASRFPIADDESLPLIDYDAHRFPESTDLQRLHFHWQAENLTFEIINQIHKLGLAVSSLRNWNKVLCRKMENKSKVLTIWNELIEPTFFLACSLPYAIRNQLEYAAAISTDQTNYSDGKAKMEILLDGYLKREFFTNATARFATHRDIFNKALKSSLEDLVAYKTICEIRHNYHHRVPRPPPGFTMARTWPNASAKSLERQGMTFGVVHGIDLAIEIENLSLVYLACMEAFDSYWLFMLAIYGNVNGKNADR